MDTEHALRALDALGQPSRLAIFRLLVQAGPAGRAVGDIRGELGLPAATLSNHLNILRQAGLVLDQRDGRSIVCRADYARMNALVGYLSENCCAGADCGVPAGGRPARSPC
jgi:ArsR family transcriptional regulator